jgi:ketosteroid isomerase-like protein
MSDHPNASIVRTGLEAFMKGDNATLAAMFADDLVWHAPGNNSYAGELVGKEASLTRMGRLAQDGVVISFDIHDIVANDEHVVVLCDATFSKGSNSVVDRQVQVMHVRDDKVTEFWAMNADQAAVDAVLNG